MQYAQMKKDANDRIVTERFMYENQEEQYRVYLYYKLAHCGILEMPFALNRARNPLETRGGRES